MKNIYYCINPATNKFGTENFEKKIKGPVARNIKTTCLNPNAMCFTPTHWIISANKAISQGCASVLVNTLNTDN